MKIGINELRTQLPAVKRARDYHLYDFSGNRYLDLYLDGGRAVLGHKAGRIVRDMKNSLEKGLSAGYPSVYPHRLLKQVQRLHKGVRALSVIFAGSNADFPVIRPFTGTELPPGSFELFLPMAGSGLVRVLVSAEAEHELPAPDPVPGYLLSGLCRAAAELVSFNEDEARKNWKAFESPLWRTDGPWLYPLVSEEVYPEIFKAFLGRGMLLSPDFRSPSCAPAVFTQGEIKPIKEIEREFC